MLQLGISLFIILLGLCALLNLLSLPGNWLIVGLVLLWHFFGPDSAGQLGWMFFALFFGLALLGEAVELLAQLLSGSKAGTSRSVMLCGMAGAFAGALMGAPFFFGFGALLGALAGAWLGSLIAELAFERHDLGWAMRAANSALAGRFLGLVVKLGLGLGMVALTAVNIWPG